MSYCYHYNSVLLSKRMKIGKDRWAIQRDAKTLPLIYNNAYWIKRRLPTPLKNNNACRVHHLTCKPVYEIVVFNMFNTHIALRLHLCS